MAYEGYGTDEDYDAWAEAMGYATVEDDPDTVVDESDITAARARGSAYIDAVYGYLFSGEPTNGINQERAWPRIDAVDIYGNVISGIPLRVIQASYEATRYELNNPGSLSVLISENEKIKRLKAGSVEIEYAGGSTLAIAGAAPMSTVIEGLLYPLIGTRMAFPAILVV